METFVNEYYTKINAATTEAERIQIKDEYAAMLQTFTDAQKQEVKAIVGKRIDSFLETLAPVDEAIEQFNAYLNRKENPSFPVNNAA